MVKKLLTLLIVGALVLPATGLISVALLVNPAVAACTARPLIVGDIPDSLTARTRDGDTVTLNRQQLTRAATIIIVGSGIPDVGPAGVKIALMAALTESGLRMLANSRAYPESIALDSDGDGTDHDSLGLFQMRPSTGWGTVAELMDATYQVRAFFGGPRGPNAGSPRGLLDISEWASLDPGVAAQTVEVSAFPDRYADAEPVAEAIVAALTQKGDDASPDSTTRVPETTRLVFPLPTGSYTFASPFGWRFDSLTGTRRFHAGSDYAAAAGTPILAVADGIVTFAGPAGDFGGLIIVESTVDGERIAAYYAHMWSDGIHVTKGERIDAGQHLGDVGSAGRSTGPHLHVEIHPGGASHSPVDANKWLQQHGALGVNVGADVRSGCGAESS